MCVAMEQEVPRLNGWQIVKVKYVAMGDIHQPVLHRKNGVIGHDREVQDHLVNFGVAVASDAKQPVFHAIQQRNDLFWRVIPW